MAEMNKDDKTFVCPICGNSHDLDMHSQYDVVACTQGYRLKCKNCSCTWSVSDSGEIYNISILDYKKFRSAITGTIKQSEKDEYDALKSLFNLMDIRAIKHYPMETISHKYNGKELVERRRSEKPYVQLIAPGTDIRDWNVLLVLTKDEYEEKYKILFEKDEKHENN